MSTLLTGLLTQFPGCRVTINTRAPRRRPQVGDRRWTVRHGWQIRRRQFSTFYRAYLSRNGRPVLEWVREADLPADELTELRRSTGWCGSPKDLTTSANRAKLAARQTQQDGRMAA